MADWITKPFARFFKIEVAAAVMLLIATVAALMLSNSDWAGPFAGFWETELGLSFGDFEFSRSLRHWINDGLMTLFFFVVALELKREIVLGELRHVRTAALSLAGALGGMLVPACIFLVLMRGQAGINGWGTVTATDTAFAIGCLAVLGSRIPPSSSSRRAMPSRLPVERGAPTSAKSALGSFFLPACLLPECRR